MNADLAFHGVILDGCGNPFVAMLYRPILQALRSGDPGRSRTAMESHLQQRIDDLMWRVLRAADTHPGPRPPEPRPPGPRPPERRTTTTAR